jgi:hypothetical protein
MLLSSAILKAHSNKGGHNMAQVNYTITGEKKKVRGEMVDYLADGYIERDGEKIPCKVGFTEYYSAWDDRINVDPSHIFIKEGITENGTHYEAETIGIF